MKGGLADRRLWGKSGQGGAVAITLLLLAFACVLGIVLGVGIPVLAHIPPMIWAAAVLMLLAAFVAPVLTRTLVAGALALIVGGWISATVLQVGGAPVSSGVSPNDDYRAEIWVNRAFPEPEYRLKVFSQSTLFDDLLGTLCQSITGDGTPSVRWVSDSVLSIEGPYGDAYSSEVQIKEGKEIRLTHWRSC